ncbi:MAG: hypothetical protein IKD10_13520, partial [Lentisphaeria bacterium]|nr:hypothetical protein [Lentisphaeria bacterium]
PSQIFPILSRGKQVFAIQRYIVCRCTPHTPGFVTLRRGKRAIVCVAAVRQVGRVGLVGQVGQALPPTGQYCACGKCGALPGV